MVGYFPIFFNKEENINLMWEVSKDDIKEFRCCLQKDKSLGPYGWLVEFFLGLYELISEDLLKVVEECRL
jgi:hypothetical protein